MLVAINGGGGAWSPYTDPALVDMIDLAGRPIADGAVTTITSAKGNTATKEGAGSITAGSALVASNTGATSPGIQFSNANLALPLAGLAGATKFDVLVSLIRGDDTFAMLYELSTNGQSPGCFALTLNNVAGGDWAVVLGGATGYGQWIGAYTTDDPFVPTVYPIVLGVSFDLTAGPLGIPRHRMDNVEVAGTTLHSTMDAGATAANSTLYIGNRHGAAYPFNGVIQSIAILNNPSEETRTRFARYMASKVNEVAA